MAIKELKHLLKHTSVYGIGTIFAQGAGFLLLPFYTKYLTPEDYGVAALVETTITIIGSVVSFGIGQSLARFYSDQNDQSGKNSVVSTTYILNWILSIIFIPILLLSSVPLAEMLFHKPDYGKYFMLSSTSMFVGFNVEIGLSYFMIRARSVLFAVVSLATTIMLISLNIYFIAFKQMGLIGIFYSTLITKSVFAVIVAIPIIFKVKPRFDYLLALRIIKFSLPLGFSSVFRIATNESDKFFINYFFSPFETGIYAVAAKIATGVHILVTSTFMSSFQSIRFEIAKGPDGPRKYGVICEQYLFIVGSFGLMIAMFADDIIRLMTAPEFYGAAILIPPLIMSYIFFGLKYQLENGILISMKTRYIFYISGASSLTNLALNFILIPRWGVWGAVFSANISNIILAVASFIVSQGLYRIEIDWIKVFKIVFSIATIFVLSFLATKFMTPAMALLAKLILSFAYVAAVLLLGIVEAGLLGSLKKKSVGVV